MPSSSLSVLIASPEVAPLAQTGGLAEVAGSLPLALRDAGCRVAVALPAYRQVLESDLEMDLVLPDVPVRLGRDHLSAQIMKAELAPDVPVYLVRRDEFYDRSHLYGGGQGDYFDNPERFIFFSRAVPAMCPAVGFVPDVILGNDWQTGLMMVLLELGALPRTAGVFTVHNMGFLGLVPPERADKLGLPDRYYGIDGLEYFGRMSLLKGGIIHSQAVTTVSPTYAREIQSPEFGQGLDGVMRAVGDKLTGILNGVDYTVWNPASDRHIAAHYTPDNPAGKSLCKAELLMKMGLSSELRERPVIGMVSRLSAQKGFSLLTEAIEDIMAMNVGLVILGTGEPVYERMLTDIAGRWPGRIGVRIGFDAPLAHEIIAGSDILLMPSLYEPCGLAQIYALKYGTTPVVRATGGLNDTVLDPRGGYDPGTGFKFGTFQAKVMVRALQRAVEAFADKDRWRAMMKAGMASDFSWDRSAGEYIRVFERAIKARRGEA